MKKLFSALIAITIISLMGCSDSFVGTNENVDPTLKKSVISLPESNQLSVEVSFVAVKKINGRDGGEILLTGIYKNQVKFYSYTQVPAGAFDGSVTIVEKVSKFAGADFLPYMTFEKPLITSIEFTGLNLSGINSGNVSFGYLAPNGSFEPSEYEEIIVDIDSGTLAVKNAKIYHFSRWCFVH